MPISCTSCGTQLPDEANFCLHCGKRLRRAAHVFAIASQKGRVGKTTTAINLAACLADAGYETLVVDLSPDADATTFLGLDSHKVGLSMYEVLVDENVSVIDVVKSELRPNLSLLPAKVDLYAADIELVYLDQRETRLKRALETVKSEYDFILIDCPCGLGLLTVNGLTAADGVILMLPGDYYFALEGMGPALNTIRLVRDRLNPHIVLFGVLVTLYGPRDKVSDGVLRELAEHFPKEKFDTFIPRNIRLSEAPSFGKTILQHDPRSPGALAYKQLAEEVIARAETLPS
ncbi:MAG: AAA family ATPase [Ktedonobacterales bacterium]